MMLVGAGADPAHAMAIPNCLTSIRAEFAARGTIRNWTVALLAQCRAVRDWGLVLCFSKGFAEIFGPRFGRLRPLFHSCSSMAPCIDRQIVEIDHLALLFGYVLGMPAEFTRPALFL